MGTNYRSGKCKWGRTKKGNCKKQSSVSSRRALSSEWCKYGVTREGNCRRKPCKNGFNEDGYSCKRGAKRVLTLAERLDRPLSNTRKAHYKEFSS
jgi:hypothetical protein